MKSLLLMTALGVVLCGCGGRGQKPIGTSVFMEPGSTFGPQSVEASPDSDVIWANTDSMLHTVTADTAGGPDSSAAYPQGIAQNKTFTWHVPSNAVPGTRYYYHCAFHGTGGNGSSLGTGMVGVIVVQ